MRNYLCIFVAILMVSLTLTGLKEYRATDSTHQSAESSNVTPGEGSEVQAQPSEDNPAGDSSSWMWRVFYRVFVFPEGITVWALLLTLCAIAAQTSETRRSAKATEDAAKASAVQAKHMVDSERPFLMVFTKGLQIWMKNCGKSPAQLIAIKQLSPLFIPFDQRANGWPMPLPPEYGDIYNTALQINIGWVAPGERRIIDTFDPTLKTFRGDVTTHFFMYGAIKYRGLYGEDQEPFETRFCYAFFGDEPFDPNGSIGMGGDYGYNQNT